MLETILKAIPPIVTAVSGGFAAIAGGTALLWSRRNEANRLREAARRVVAWLQDRRPKDLLEPAETIWQQMPAQHRADLLELTGGTDEPA